MKKIIFGEDHLDKITIKILKKLLPHLKASDYDHFLDEAPIEIPYDLLKKHLASKANKGLLTLLETEQITFQAIDPLPASCEPLPDHVYEAIQPARDRIMATAFHKAPLCFGRVGLSHLSGIRNFLIETLGEETVNQDYCFIYIDNGIVLSQTDEEALPETLHRINARELNKNEIVAYILTVIGIEPRESPALTR